jgi:pimeloyl-ACP methyl ester carboxylesterase
MTLVRRRHVIYVQGYDPRGLPEYHRMFRAEYQKFCKLYGLDGTIGKRSEAVDRFSTTWPVTTAGDGWRVETAYEFLRWEDIIREDFERPAWWAIAVGLRDLLVSIVDGTFPRIMHAHWRFGLFVAYPIVVVLGFALLAALVGMFATALAGKIIPPGLLPEIIGLAAGCIGFAALLKLTEPQTYVVYIFQDAISTVQYAKRRRPDWEERLELFATAVVEAARAATADEILVVGHSSGSFLAVDVLTRALKRDPKLGSYGPRVTLLTMGGNLPIVGFQPVAGWFRDRLTQLAADPTLDWVDYQSRRDIMNFFRLDPLAVHGIDPAKAKINLRVVPVQFREIVSPQTFSRLVWHFFDLHFQFLRANEYPHAFDYFMIVAGPFSLRTRLANPADVVTAVGADKTAAHAARKRLESRTAQQHGGDRCQLPPP